MTDYFRGCTQAHSLPSSRWFRARNYGLLVTLKLHYNRICIPVSAVLMSSASPYTAYPHLLDLMGIQIYAVTIFLIISRALSYRLVSLLSKAVWDS